MNPGAGPGDVARSDPGPAGVSARCRQWRPRGEDGSEAVELAILLPVILTAIAVLVVGARIALSGQRISGVAGAASREASLVRSPAAAQQAATVGAMSALASAGLHCTDTKVTVDTSGFAARAGTPAVVTVTVSCDVSLSSIGIAGLPGSQTLRDTASSPLDPARDLS